MNAATTGPIRRILVAGTAGGVGTTTVAALLFALWPGRAGAPLLADRTAGTLGLRLPEGDDVPTVDSSVLLVDAGPRALARVADLADPAVLLVMVSAATPQGCLLAAECLDHVRGVDAGPPRAEDADGSAGASTASARTALVLAGSFGRHRIDAAVTGLTGRPHGHALSTVLPPDRALAAGGRIPLARLSERTRTAVLGLASAISAPVPFGGARVSA